MKTLTINFIGGKPQVLKMSEDMAQQLIKALAADPRGTTEIAGNNGLFCVVNRAHITYVEIAE